VLRTTDGGATWRQKIVPGAGDLDFRDVHAFDDQIAFILSVGAGDLSRIYKTSDGGATWALSYRNHDSRGFLDAIAFWDKTHGIVQGDPVDGRFVILSTDDGGMSWHGVSAPGMPAALDGEGAFAASGTCLVVQDDRNAWFCTGGAKTARVFRSSDGGQNWSVSETPVMAGSSSSGIFSVAFRDSRHGVAVGGDFKHPEQGGRVISRTDDGGRTWSLPRGPGPRAFRSAAVYIPGSSPPTVIAVGPNGADISSDDGETWKPLAGRAFHALDCAGPGAGWGVGEAGRICRYPERSMRPR
jgi:photosystem II stability/assembly factor-like uncharacterized protein